MTITYVFISVRKCFIQRNVLQLSDWRRILRVCEYPSTLILLPILIFLKVSDHCYIYIYIYI